MADSEGALEPETVVQKRVSEVLQQLSETGHSPATVASKLGIPVQYLSDYKAARRRLSERVARRFEDEFGFNWQWLLGRSEVRHSTATGAQLSSRTPSKRVMLPIFAEPIEGDPSTHPKWDGGLGQVVGAARAKLALAKQPYLLRFGADDHQKRLSRGDLILMSQSILTEHAGIERSIQVIRDGRGLYLARRLADGKWKRLSIACPESLPATCTVLGHVVGIVWGAIG